MALLQQNHNTPRRSIKLMDAHCAPAFGRRFIAIQYFPQFSCAEILTGLHETLNWSNILRSENGNWFERRKSAYCQIGAQSLARI